MGRMGIVDPFERHRKKRISDHLTDFENHLRDNGDSEQHVRLTTDRASAILTSCEFVLIDDISPGAVESFLAEFRARGRSIQTSNHYLRAIKQFCRWLVTDRRTSDNRIAHLKMLNVKTDRRHDRRALSADEFATLIESAETGPSVEGVLGSDRAMLYILAAWTGFRRKELSSLTFRSFKFDGELPTVRVQASYSKRRRTDSIPLHPVVVNRLRAWLETKGDIDRDQPLFALRTAGGHFRKTAKMMRLDLERQGILYVDEDGLYADFHSNRHTFISNLGKAGVSPKMAQTLARHSDINLTMNTYTHLGLRDQAAAVQNLPAPPKSPAGELRATRTGDVHVPAHVPPSDLSSPNLAPLGDKLDLGNQLPARNESGIGGSRGANWRELSDRGSDAVRSPIARRTRSSEPRVGGSSPSGCTLITSTRRLDRTLVHSRRRIS